jgi:hypothetical protein
MKNSVVFFLLFCIINIIFGCGSTKPFYNPGENKLHPGKSRIVFTRESQALGAAVTINVFEYGDNVESNGIIAFRKNVKKNVPEIIKIDLLWFDSVSLKYVSKGPNYRDDGNLKSKPGVFHYGDIVLTCNNYNEVENYNFSADKNGHVELDDETEINKLLENSIKYQIQTNIAWVLNKKGIPDYNYNYKISEIVDKIKNKELEQIRCSVLVHDGSKITGEYKADCFKVPQWNDIIPATPFKDSSCVISFVSQDKKIIDFKHIFYSRILGPLKIGQTIVWDRNPGYLNLGVFDYSGGRTFQKKLLIEEGKTYYFKYEAFVRNKPHFALIDVVDSN